MQHSEYQKRFRPVGPSVVESHYAQLLAYRRARRSTEASHHSWAWADAGSDSDSKDERADLSDVEEQPEEARVAKRLSRSPQRNGFAHRNGALTASEDEEEEDDEEEEVAARLKRLALRKALEKEGEGGRPQKPRHPKNRAPIPKPLKSKEPPQASSKFGDKPEATSHENPMFVLYGRGNRNDQGTFNVRSDRDVIPSAVRANRRRQAEIERRRNAKLVVPAREKRSGKDPTKGLARMQMQRETAAWQSEYQKNFPNYEMACYRRSLSNLTPRPVSAMI